MRAAAMPNTFEFINKYPTVNYNRDGFIIMKLISKRNNNLRLAISGYGYKSENVNWLRDLYTKMGREVW